MQSSYCRRALGACLVAGAVIAADAVRADTLDQIMQIRGQTLVAMAKSQKKIDLLADQHKDLLNEYRAVTKQVDSLKIYNTQLRKLVSSQQEEMDSLQRQIEGVTGVEREIRPLMEEMVAMLAQFVEADVPFLIDERRERVAFLEELLERADVTVAEQYRQVMEAYTVENQFGSSILAYTAKIKLEGESEEREVDFLRIGRLGLYYRSLDGDLVGMWNQDSRRWESIDSSYSNAIKLGLRIARKQAPPGLMILPVQAAQQGEES